MKENRFKQYIYWGITALAVIGIAIGFSFLINQFKVVRQNISLIIRVLMPVIYGGVMAFLLNPVYNKIYVLLTRLLKKGIKNRSLVRKVSVTLSTLTCVFLVLFVITALIWMIIPQIIQSIIDMINNLPKDLTTTSAYAWIENLVRDNPDIELWIRENYTDWLAQLTDLRSSSLFTDAQEYIRRFSDGLMSVIREVFNFIIGLIVMMYLLNMKPQLIAQSKKLCYGLFSLEMANSIIEEARYIKQVFSNFIVGKIIDSIIIGIINYLFMSIIKMPYSLLISVVVGVTNVIPFFGPFIGAIPSIIILLLVSPFSALQFAVWILILQQIDGNIIGPKILGQTTGLPSFWILFSILLFGGLFGIVGMIIAVPTWAVIYRNLSKLTNHKLKGRQLAVESSAYTQLDYIDEQTGAYIKLEETPQ